jgi:hypothetical protein
LKYEVVQGDLVGQLDPGAAGGGTARAESIQRVHDHLLILPRRAIQHQPGRAGVDHDRHSIVLAQLIDQHLHALFQ